MEHWKYDYTFLEFKIHMSVDELDPSSSTPSHNSAIKIF